MHNLRDDPRFGDIKPFKNKVWLSSPTMHGEELQYVTEAYQTNWMSTIGANINELEQLIAKYVGVNYAIALSSGTAALHLAVKLAADHLYNSSTGISTPSGLGLGGALLGRRVFCSDMTFGATVNPILYEGGETIFIDTEYDTWNMDPIALEKAFQLYPDVKLVVIAHLYGVPGKIDEIQSICKRYNALIIEDAAESLGATYNGLETGTLGDFGAISFNGNKIITGSTGGMFLTNNIYDADKVRKWSTQSREAAPWYQHEEIGYNYRMSNVIAGVVRGQMYHLKEHIKQKKEIYFRYLEGLKDLPIKLNPYDLKKSEPNYWLSAMIIDSDSMAMQVRGEMQGLYDISHGEGKSSPSEILEALEAFNVEGRPIWKPMHLQPIFRNNAFVCSTGSGRKITNAYTTHKEAIDVSTDIFNRGLCLPSDIKMTLKEQKKIIEIIHRCFL